MSSKIINDLSGVIINQNQRPGEFDWRTPGGWFYQEFYLPTTFTRGAGDERVVPELSGFSFFMGTESLNINVEWSLEYLVSGIGWISIASGAETQAPLIGERMWINFLFDDPVSVPEEALTNRWHIGLRLNSSVSKVWFSRPNPLAIPHNAQATNSSFIALGSPAYSFLFRVLALTADAGTDFLGNSYRSAVTFNKPDNASTVDGTKDKFWLSKPNPSRFAVENLYYDLRPRQDMPVYGLKNMIKNPNFKQSPTPLSGWSSSVSGAATISLAGVTDSEFANGGATASISGGMGQVWNPVFGTPDVAGSDGMVSVHEGEQWILTIDVRANTTLGSSFNPAMTILARTWDGTTVNTITLDTSGAISLISPGSHLTMVGYVQIPAGVIAIAPQLQLTMEVANATITVGRFLATKLPPTPIYVEYFDGDMPNVTWMGPRHDSASVQVLQPAPLDDTAVVDKVLVDPLTPGIYFSIYYTSEGDPGKTQEEWDNKLWTRVPQTFHAVKRDTHALAEPIQAKYIKIEFTHLQARSYSPGNFAKPITYQKHPKWVLDYFLARTASAAAVTSALDVGRVAISFDAYDLAYNYYLDDLGQTSNTPFEIDPRFQSLVTNYLSATDDLSDRIDPIMLDKIRVALNPYRSQISSFAAGGTILGDVMKATNLDNPEYPVERNTVNYNDTQQLRNEAVVFENEYPVMFFYLTCRHAYRVVKAAFDNNKAFFAGVKEVAFTRENYTVAYDTQLYIEPHGDLLNTERNDFKQVEGSLIV
jgi:hypothetical protein